MAGRLRHPKPDDDTKILLWCLVICVGSAALHSRDGSLDLLAVSVVSLLVFGLTLATTIILAIDRRNSATIRAALAQEPRDDR